MATLQDYAIPVHKSLQQPDLILGIPKAILLLIFALTVLLIYIFNFAFALTAPVLYVPCYFISKDDPHLLVISIESLFELDLLEG